MICQWDTFIRLIPQRMRHETEHLGKKDLLEFRLRAGRKVQLVLLHEIITLNEIATIADLKFVINTASQYSPWAAATVCHGFITAEGGHRIGICGECVSISDHIAGIRTPTSVCIRVARDFPKIAADVVCGGSILIIGMPGSGKTTLLRDLIRQRSEAGQGSVAVVDERGELFPQIHGISIFNPGANTDVLTGCGKKEGIEILLRTMGPRCIAVDEITGESDASALLSAGWSGIELLATAHASSSSDLLSRDIYRPLLTRQLFQTLLIMNSDKTWHTERICL